MTDWYPNDEEAAAALQNAQEYHRRVSPIISCRLQPQLTSAFDELIKLVNEPTISTALSDWDPKAGRWSARLVGGINSHARQALTIAAYHHLRLKEMDEAVVEALRGFLLQPNQVMGGGDTTAMDAEYQAFILSCRRCLDQLVYALSAAFKNEADSFRTFASGFLKQQRNRRLADALSEVYLKHEVKFGGGFIQEMRFARYETGLHTGRRYG